MHEISKLDNHICETGAAQMALLAQALVESIPSDKRSQDAYRVLNYLAEQTIKHGTNASPVHVMTKAIHTDLSGNRNREPAAWLSPIWASICRRAFPAIEPALIRRCRAMGMDHYPRVGKTAGNPTYYYLYPELLPAEGTQGQTCPAPAQSPTTVLTYAPDLTLQLSRLGKLLFRNGLNWSSGRRRGLMAWFGLLLLVGILATGWLWLVLASDTTPLSTSHLAAVSLMLAVPWFLIRQGQGLMRLFEDRIMLAPDWMLHWKEFGATVEFTKGLIPDAPRIIKVVRYTAICPICAAMVKLDRGEPDFPRRLVGRCEESPREHVFTFDRITQSGEPLIRPPAILRAGGPPTINSEHMDRPCNRNSPT